MFSIVIKGLLDDLSLTVLDDSGMLSMLIYDGMDDYTSQNLSSLHLGMGGSWTWLPLLDLFGLQKSSKDCFCPISILNGKLLCAPLKGGVMYPDASRRPVTAMLSLRTPLAKAKGDGGER